MKFLKLFFFSFFLYASSVASNDINLSNENNRFEVLDKTKNSFKIVNQINQINTNKIKTEFGDFIKLTVPYYSTNSEIGNPELPSLMKLISVPNASEVDINIINKTSKKIKLSDFGINDKILPNQPSISKSANEDEIIFHINESSYKIDDLSNEKLVSTEFLGKMRGVQLARIIISPLNIFPSFTASASAIGMVPAVVFPYL